jgi:malonyl CoA-acyl carrier protein transacylase
VATFTQLASGNWRVQVRRKNRYVSEIFRRRKDGEDWALDMGPSRIAETTSLEQSACRCWPES